MEKNELSRIPDSDAVVSPDNPDDPNDPVGTTDDPNDPATNIVVSPDDPNTCALLTDTLKEIRSTCAFVTNTLKEIRAEQEKVNNDSESYFGSEQSRTSSTYDPNDPVVTTDDLNDPATDAARRRNKEMEKNEQSRIHARREPPKEEPKCQYRRSFNDRRRPSQVEFNNGPNNTDPETDSENYHGFYSGEIEVEIEQLEKFLEGASLKNIHEPVIQCCIYKVPKDLRKINKEAYTPQVISIGPFHYGDKELIEMEKQKLRYISEFRKREGGAEKLEEFKRYIQANKKKIRNYYQEENSKLKGHRFVNMILCDSVFIIEFFLKNANVERKQKKEFDFFLDTACVKATITRDLQLLENQLPYFLLKKLFKKGAFHNFTKEDYPNRDPFLILCHRFFFNSENDDFPKPKDQIQHFTDLRRHFLLMDFHPQDPKQGEHVRDLPTATKLHGSGVKLKKEIEGGSSLEISCEYVPRAMRILGFKGCEIRIPFIKELRLQIPHFEIDDNSECLYRNMMALELCHYPSETHICNFIVLMDFLINTEKDVDLFVEEGIIFSLLGDNAAVANMFNNLGLQITPSFSVYHNIGEKLKAHYARPWNRTMANLNTVYFGDIWKGTATVGAVILLVLTFVQTMISIRSLF